MWSKLAIGMFLTAQLIQEEESQGIPPLVWVVFVAVLIGLGVWWWLRRSPAEDSHAKPTHQTTSHDSHQQPAHVAKAAPAAMVHADPQTAESHSPVAKAPTHPDDLTIIEGIGPKIASLLQEAGIKTFSQLAATPVNRLQEMMLNANLRIADPTSWPEQATLAAAGKIDELQKLQDSLKGGRKA